MAEISVVINGRPYRLECGDGEEGHLVGLAEHINGHVETMRARFGQVGDERLILMAALMVADELWETKTLANQLQSEVNQTKREAGAAEALRRGDRAELADILVRAAERIEAFNHSLAYAAPEPDDEAPVD